MEFWELRQRQSLSLEAKIIHSENVIRKWYEYWNGQVYISFSGGKDSTVLLHLVRNLYPNIPAVFINTGLEYPEIREFVKSIDNVVWVKPKLLFTQVIDKYGYPVISKEQALYIQEYRTTKSEKLKEIRYYGKKNGLGKISDKWKYLIDAPFKISDKCCDYLKKNPINTFEKETNLMPFLGVMASDGSQRQGQYLKYGCSIFEGKRPRSRPLSIWLEEDIWEYLKKYNIPYSDIYNMGESRTGCMFCMFGCHLEKNPNKFERMKIAHPQLYDYCINKLELGKVLNFINVKY